MVPQYRKSDNCNVGRSGKPIIDSDLFDACCPHTRLTPTSVYAATLSQSELSVLFDITTLVPRLSGPSPVYAANGSDLSTSGLLDCHKS